MIPLYDFLIIIAIGFAIVVEVIVAYQKYQMKKNLVNELGQMDKEGRQEQADSNSNPK